MTLACTDAPVANALEDYGHDLQHLRQSHRTGRTALPSLQGGAEACPASDGTGFSGDAGDGDHARFPAVAAAVACHAGASRRAPRRCRRHKAQAGSRGDRHRVARGGGLRRPARHGRGRSRRPARGGAGAGDTGTADCRAAGRAHDRRASHRRRGPAGCRAAAKPRARGQEPAASRGAGPGQVQDGVRTGAADRRRRRRSAVPPWKSRSRCRRCRSCLRRRRPTAGRRWPTR